MEGFKEKKYKIFELFDKQWTIVTAGSMAHYNSCTYVDGKMILPNTEVPIQQGTKIRLGNEDFEFKLR